MAIPGRPLEMEDRVTFSISVPMKQKLLIKELGFNLSEFYREAGDLKLQTLLAPEDQLQKEIEEKQKLIDDTLTIMSELQSRLKGVQEFKRAQDEAKQQQEVLISQRIELFNNKYRKLIYSNSICQNDFYRNIKKDMKFDDATEARDWLYGMYKIPQDGCKAYTEDRIRTFLRMDSDLSRFW
jgi:hypothetical protein